MTSSVPLRELLLTTKDGDWGKSALTEGHVPYRVIRGGDFPQARIGDISSIPTRYLPQKTVLRRTLQGRDILIETAGGTRDRPTGRTLFVTSNLLQRFVLPTTCASFARFLRVDPNKTEPEYVFWYLQYLYSIGEMWQHQVQHTGVARFQYTRFAATERIPLPPRDEQRAIAMVLGSLDDKIRLNRQMNHTLEAMAQALFRSWFVDFDPVVAKADGRNPYGMDAETAALFPDRFVQSELGPIPGEWNIQPLDTIADFLNGLALQKYPPEEGRWLPVIKIAQLRAGAPVNADRASADIDDKYILQDGDVVFSWSGSLLATIWCGGPGALNQHLFKVTSQSYPKWFYYHWTKEHLPEFQRIAAGKATTMGHIRRFHLTLAKVAVPPPPVLSAADRLLEPICSLVIHNNLENRALGSLREALLPKLLSGEICLGEAEKAVEEAI